MRTAVDSRANSQRPTRTLWVVQKDGHSVRCLLSGEPGREELRILVDRELYLSEIHTVHEGVIGRADTLHRGFEAHGWTTVLCTPPPLLAEHQ